MQHDDSAKTVLVIGQGMLGLSWRPLLEMLETKGVTHHCVDRMALDVTDEQAVVETISDQIELVVNTAAFTDVDRAEAEPELAHLVNGTAVGYLARRCQDVGATLIHYSTDYVFNGRANQPYAVTAPHDPINAYGRSKAAGENALLSSGCNQLLIRTSWLYAPWGKNFIRAILAALHEKEVVPVVTDQRGRPTSAEFLVAASWELYQRGARGTFHVCDDGECSWFEFAQEIAQISGAPGQVRASAAKDFPRPAPRPAYSVLDLSQTANWLGVLPRWQENVAKVVSDCIGEMA